MTLIGLHSQLSSITDSVENLLEPSNLSLIPSKYSAGNFSGISLRELGADSLLERQETKYLLPLDRLESLLHGLETDYRILEIQGRRSFDYHSVYFDTPDRFFYVQHQAGALPRWKIRQRIYLNSGLSYLEVKFKDNRGVTHKSRLEIYDPTNQMADQTRHFLDAHYPGEANNLEPALETRYSRITLVRKTGGERITLDRRLRFSQGANTRSLSDLVIAEIKQTRHNPRSPFTNQLKQLGIRPGSFSKYCIGSTLSDPSLKHNRFKPILLQIAALNLIGEHHEWTL